MTSNKKSFRSTEWPPLSFYHRIVRVLIGMVVLVVSIYQIYVSFFYFLLFAFFSSPIKSAPAITQSEAEIGGLGLLVFVISNIAWVAAALMLIFKAVYRRSVLSTICALAGLVPAFYFGSVFLEHTQPSWSVLVPTIAVAHLGLAIGTIYFSKWSRPTFQYQFRDDSTDSAQENPTTSPEK